MHLTSQRWHLGRYVAGMIAIAVRNAQTLRPQYEVLDPSRLEPYKGSSTVPRVCVKVSWRAQRIVSFTIRKRMIALISCKMWQDFVLRGIWPHKSDTCVAILLERQQFVYELHRSVGPELGFLDPKRLEPDNRTSTVPRFLRVKSEVASTKIF